MSERQQLTALLALSGLVWTAYAVGSGAQLEDALITYRYAENLIAGNGLVYNIGERVLGTTTMLFALLLAAGGALFGEASIPVVALVISFAAMLATGELSYRILRKFGVTHYPSLLAVASLLFHPHMVWSYCGRMETALVIYLMTHSLYALIRRQYLLSGSLAALLVMTRPDGLIWAGMLGVAVIVSDPKRSIRFVMPAVVIGAAYVAGTTAYYGSPIPQSVLAKSVVGLESFTLYRKVRWWLSMFSIYPAPDWVVIPALLLAIWTLCRGQIISPAKIVFFTFPFVYATIFVIGSAPLFPWYSIPLKWAVTMITVAGSAMWVSAKLKDRKHFGKFSFALGSVWLLTLLVALVQLFKVEVMAQANEDEGRRKLGEWINEHAQPADRVALEPLGYVGYYSRRRIIDMAGLISPEIVEYRRRSSTNAQAFAMMIAELKPEYIVLRSIEVDSNRHLNGGKLFASAIDSLQFRATHEEVYRVKVPYTEIWGRDSSFSIFHRKASL